MIQKRKKMFLACYKVVTIWSQWGGGIKNTYKLVFIISRNIKQQDVSVNVSKIIITIT